MEKSESIKNLALALVKFNGLVKKVNKGSDNPFFKSKYAALPDILAAIHEPLIQSGLVINQFPTGNHGLTTILIHAESGEYMMDTYTMTPSKNDPQGIGSCITYQRRYAVGAVLSLNIDEDDDGNKASEKLVYKPKVEVKTEIIELTEEEAVKQIETAKTRVEFVSVWNNNPKLHKNKSVLDAVTKAGLKFPKQS